MRALIQRVKAASVTVDDPIVGGIGAGLLILVCAMEGDGEIQVNQLAAKLSKLRIFKDDAGKMNKSLLDTSGAALVVSQFALAADTSRGNRPGFSSAAKPDQGEILYEHFAGEIRKLGIEVAMGRFGAEMSVALVNDGPVTIWLEV